MPIVPRQYNVTRDTKESILGTRRKSWPVVQTQPGEFKGLRQEMWRKTSEAQRSEQQIGSSVPINPQQWEKFLSQGPKSKNIVDRRQSPDQQLEPWEARAYSQSVREASGAYYTKPTIPEKPPSGLQPSMKGIATKELGLNEQEQFLYQHHLDNYAKGGVSSAGGTKTSSILAITVGSKDKSDPKTYVVPTIWDNKILSKDEAIQRADDLGLEKFPSYDSREQANARYSQMHRYMDQDMQ